MKRFITVLTLTVGLAASASAQQRTSQYAELGSDVAPAADQYGSDHNTDGSTVYSFPTVAVGGAQRSIFLTQALSLEAGNAFCGKVNKSFIKVMARKPVRYERWAQLDQNGNASNFGQFDKPPRSARVIEWIICR